MIRLRELYGQRRGGRVRARVRVIVRARVRARVNGSRRESSNRSRGKAGLQARARCTLLHSPADYTSPSSALSTPGSQAETEIGVKEAMVKDALPRGPVDWDGMVVWD